MPILTSLPEPRYKVEAPTNENGGHVYRVLTDPILELRGVTTFLNIISKPALIQWAKNVALDNAGNLFHAGLESKSKEQTWHEWVDVIIASASKQPKTISDKALDIGTRLHCHIEEYIKACMNRTSCEVISDDIKPIFDNFLKWQAEEEIQWLGAEIPCASIKHKYGTMVDGLGIVNGKINLYEFKTSAAIYKEYFLQTAAEAFALEETYGVDIDAAFIVRFGKDGKFNTKKDIQKLKNPEKAFELFLHAKALWDGLNY